MQETERKQIEAEAERYKEAEKLKLTVEANEALWVSLKKQADQFAQLQQLHETELHVESCVDHPAQGTKIGSTEEEHTGSGRWRHLYATSIERVCVAERTVHSGR